MKHNEMKCKNTKSIQIENHLRNSVYACLRSVIVMDVCSPPRFGSASEFEY